MRRLTRPDGGPVAAHSAGAADRGLGAAVEGLLFVLEVVLLVQIELDEIVVVVGVRPVLERVLARAEVLGRGARLEVGLALDALEALALPRVDRISARGTVDLGGRAAALGQARLTTLLLALLRSLAVARHRLP